MSDTPLTLEKVEELERLFSGVKASVWRDELDVRTPEAVRLWYRALGRVAPALLQAARASLAPANGGGGWTPEQQNRALACLTATYCRMGIGPTVAMITDFLREVAPDRLPMRAVYFNGEPAPTPPDAAVKALVEAALLAVQYEFMTVDTDGAPGVRNGISEETYQRLATALSALTGDQAAVGEG